MKVAIIHEIAHAVVGALHGDAWRKEILHAAEVARIRKDSHMVKLLKREASHESIFDYPESFYKFIDEKANEYPVLRFETFLSRISNIVKYSPEEIMEEFPETRRRYNERQAISRNYDI
jgi:hypothetical protein